MMEYEAQPWLFRMKKVMRYCRLYGPRRTYVKVQGKRHMKRRFAALPPCSHKLGPSQIVGLIGCGNYAFSNIAYYLRRKHGRVIGACMDVDLNRAASMSRHYGAPLYTADAEELLANDTIRLVFVASNHASHAEYAIRALQRGKDVYIEKPHVVSEDQLVRLVDAMKRSGGRVYLGFNRPASRFGRLIRSFLEKEAGSAMYSWFVAGHRIDSDHWYREPQEGGRVLGNLCHWTDFLFTTAGENALPALITPGGQSEDDLVVSFTFADTSIGVISFSVKSETFEGIKEHFSAHKGRCLITMDDFQSMTVEVGDWKRHYRNWHRDQGHRANILGAFENSIQRLPYDHDRHLTRIVNTARLFLGTKEALDKNQPLWVEPYRKER